MNLRCAFCQTPFAIGRVEKIAALQHMDAENLTHYDAHCPRCRKATPVLRQKLEMTLPNWRDALHELEQQTEASPASISKPEAAPASKAESAPELTPSKHRSRAGSKPKPVEKQETGRPQASRSELGKKAPAKNTPSIASAKGKKKSK